ncbi:maleylpyruvate isomerase family mycothiol-dependent enzyme [Geodermatophilus maliterrae]|uniref:Maleylpyruvate isomerase family mycothiol-dependent enzyme n=1 Tax=Geodermatophilus maliterrae TaxID=3162531 RepID=A0ABV3XJL2_9ACTN
MPRTAARNEVWPVVHAERWALADDLEGLAPDRWATPSLCAGWDVHDVLAHLVDDARTTPVRFLTRFAAARFDFDAYTARGVRAERAADPAVTLAAFRAAVCRTTSAPAPRDTRLVEVFVHGEDVRRPLGIAHDPPRAAVARALRFQARSSDAVGGGRARVAGVTLAATDTDLRLGDGPEVRGPVVSLLLLAAGRTGALADLSGPGVDVVAERA